MSLETLLERKPLGENNYFKLTKVKNGGYKNLWRFSCFVKTYVLDNLHLSNKNIGTDLIE